MSSRTLLQLGWAKGIIFPYNSLDFAALVMGCGWGLDHCGEFC